MRHFRYNLTSEPETDGFELNPKNFATIDDQHTDAFDQTMESMESKMRTFQEHQNAMIKSLRDHVQSLSDQLHNHRELNRETRKLVQLLNRLALNPSITDLGVFRLILQKEIQEWEKFETIFLEKTNGKID